MKNLETIADELFNKIRGRFPNITVGDDKATITNKPGEARFFEFDFAEDKKVSISIDEDALTVMYSQDLFSEDETTLKSKWFLKQTKLQQCFDSLLSEVENCPRSLCRNVNICVSPPWLLT